METNFRDEVNALIYNLGEVLEDAGKFDRGNETAGVRARKALLNAAGRCALLRKSMLAVSAERRASK